MLTLSEENIQKLHDVLNETLKHPETTGIMLYMIAPCGEGLALEAVLISGDNLPVDFLLSRSRATCDFYLKLHCETESGETVADNLKP